MTVLAFLRHGLTDWNVERRLQGRRDVPINDEGRAMAAAWRLPAELAGAPVVSSPLARCIQTADILMANHPGLGPLAIDARLVERSWGIWEGRTLHEMEAAAGAAAHAAAYRPEGGESRRDLAPRVGAFLADAAADPGPGARVVITHRGVIRTVYALATGWDMCGESPDELSRRKAQLFRATPEGGAAVERLNLRLAAPADGGAAA